MANGETYIVSNKFWDMFLQKLFSQFISVKIWVITLITVMRAFDQVTDVQYAAILTTIMAMKGVFNFADVWKRNGTNGEIIDKV